MLKKIASSLAKIYIKNIHYRKKNTQTQENILIDILERNKNCKYGKQYKFSDIQNYDDFKNTVPIIHYEDVHSFLQQTLRGEEKILTIDKVLYMAKTSWTSSWESKYLPVTEKALIENHFKAGKDLYARYLHNNPNSRILEGKTLALWWGFSPNTFGGEVKIWYISAILQKEGWVLGKIFKEPSEDISFSSNWEQKIPQIIRTTKDKNITATWGVPSRWAILFQHFLETTEKKNMLEIWPNFELYLSWWMSFEPYREKFKKLFPSNTVNFYDVYNASEGFFWFQYQNNNSEMKLLLQHGVFYEFITADTYNTSNPTIINIDNIKKNIDYVLTITTYWGLYRYVIWDIIRFTNTQNKLFRITGRTKLTLDSFAEHLIVDNIEQALIATSKKTKSKIYNYHVAPLIYKNSSWRHDRIIEFEQEPKSLEIFTKELDKNLQKRNGYYAGKRKDNILIKPPHITIAPQGTFFTWMKNKGKLWGQNKFPQLSNERKILEEILAITKE